MGLILIDTSALIDSLTGPRRSEPLLRRLVEQGERPALSSLILYEWLRGPRTREELMDQEFLFPAQAALPFEALDALAAARLYRSIRRSRQRAMDLAIAACAIRRDAQLWTLNRADFADIPGLKLWRP